MSAGVMFLSSMVSCQSSSYVPRDSWIYAAFDRLIGTGVISTAYAGVRPWTRDECRRLLDEAEEKIRASDAGADNSVTSAIVAALADELGETKDQTEARHSLAITVDSIYFRASEISGSILRDGYHFGQTVVNDYGRPYGEGVSSVAGIETRAQAGRLTFFARTEFQHAPSLQSDPVSVIAATAQVDGTLPLLNKRREINRVRLLEGTIGYALKGMQFTLGRQSLWLGPSEAGPLLFSSNAEPMPMLRIESSSPYEAPLFSRVLGPVQSEFFLARLSGQTWEYSPRLFGPGLRSQPFLHGTKFSFHPTANLELGFGFTAQFAGPGNPFTWANLARTFYSHRVGVGKNPAKRLSEFDLSYRVPGLRNWLQIYCDSMVIDEYSPIGSNRPAINPGIYLPRLPWLENVELRIEGITTDLNVPDHFGAGAFYWDGRYRSGYTHDGNLIGSWVGRRGRAEQAWLTYHFSPESTLQVGFRHSNVDKAFLGGGRMRDLSVKSEWKLTRQVGVTAWLQQEQWHFSLLNPAGQSNFLASFELTLWPERRPHN
jgi:Capsule assembly protein Wzi